MKFNGLMNELMNENGSSVDCSSVCSFFQDVMRCVVVVRENLGRAGEG